MRFAVAVDIGDQMHEAGVSKLVPGFPVWIDDFEQLPLDKFSERHPIDFGKGLIEMLRQPETEAIPRLVS